MTKFIDEFFVALRAGLPMGKRFIWRWVNFILFWTGVGVIIGGTIYPEFLGNRLIRMLIWAIVAISFGLTPYCGAKEQSRAIITDLEKSLNNWRNKANELETKIAQYRDKFGEIDG